MIFRTTLLPTGKTAAGIVVPPEIVDALDDALDDEPEARTRFDALSYSAQQRLTLPIENARTPQTRQRRVEAALHALRDPAD